MSSLRMSFSYVKILLMFVAILLATAGGLFWQKDSPSTAYAATNTLTTCNDSTLRSAISTAAAGDTINFSCSGTITLTASLSITKNLTIDGTGQNVIISGNNAYQIFNVSSGAKFTVTSLTLTKGSATDGGAIANSGTLTVTSTIFSSNTATNNGGAIANFGTGIISSIISSTFSANSAGSYGSAIINGGNINNISNSTFANNGGSSFSTLANFNQVSSISNSTFVSNTAEAIYNFNFSTISSISNSTFASNGDLALDNGSGVKVTVKNSVLAHTGTVSNCFGSITDGGYNLSDDASCSFTGTGSQNSVSNLNLGTLASNGGPTQTILPGQNSATIDAIPVASCGVTTDQRGYTRPQGNGCDVGAVEAQFSSETFSITGGNSQQAAENTQYALPLSVTITDNSSGPSVGVSGVQVVFTAPSSSSSITFTNGSNVFTATTNSSGIAASSIFTANNQPGYVTVTVTINYANLNPHTVKPRITSPVYFQLINTYPNGITKLTVSKSSLNFTGPAGATTPITAQALTLAAAANTNWSSSVSYGAGTKDWLSLDKSSGILLVGNPQNVGVRANSTGLAVGTYTAALTFQENGNAANSVTVNVSLTVTTSGAGTSPSYSYYLPIVANNMGGFTSHATVQNVGNGPATLAAQYYDANGNSITIQSAICPSLAVNASCVPNNPFASGTKGTGVIVSNQPLSVLVQEQTPFGSSAYAVSAGASASLVAPLAINNAVGFNTQLTLANVGPSATTATITFYDQNGNALPAATQTLNLAAHSSQTLDQTAANSNLPSGFYGWAQITGANEAQLVAQVLEIRTDIKFTALANAQAVGAARLFAPAIFRNAFGGFVSGANIVNPNNNSVQISITYYDSTGKAYTTTSFTLAAHAVSAIYQGATSGNGIPAGGLPNGFYGSATVSSSGGNVVMVVNEAGTQTKAGAAQSGTYAAASGGASSIGLPIVANSGNGYTSGLTILNTGDTPVIGSITYYNPDGTVVASTNQSFNITAHASQPVYQGAAGLPQSFYGQAVVSSTSNSLLVTTNSQSDNLFFTYTESGNGN